MTENLKDNENILDHEEENIGQQSATADTNAVEETETTDDVEVKESMCKKTTEELLAEAQAQIEDLKSQALYRQAEFENFRRRTIKEKADLILNGSKSAVLALLPIVDDLERALPSMKKAEDVVAVAEGVELIYQKFLKALAGLGVKQIETEGKDFDVDLHEAIAQVPGVPDEQKGRVIDCVEKGYTLNEHVIRHAKVAVGM